MTVEQMLSRELRTILTSVPVGGLVVDSPTRRELMSLLEGFVHGALREVHAEWKYEGLDGVLPEVMRKTGENQAETIGLCILISDQTMSPLCVRLRVARDSDEIDWFECKLGECGPDGMIRIPYGRGKLAVADCVDHIEWAYKVGFGEHQVPTDEQ